MSTRIATTNAHARGAVCVAVIAILLTAGAMTAGLDLARYEADERGVKYHLRIFDALDFNVFTPRCGSFRGSRPRTLSIRATCRTRTA